jgi:LysM repeat protein
MATVRWRKGWRLGALLLCLTAACARTEDPSYARGQRYLRQGKQDLALRCFLVATQRGSHHAGEAHLECAEIYLNGERDPLTAIYHYRQYLRHAPNDRQAALVRQRIETAEKIFLEQIPLLRRRTGENQVDLLRTLRLLQEENFKLKQRQIALVARLRQMREQQAAEDDMALPAAESTPSPTVAEEGRVGGGTYTVAKGDTLSSISLRLYGTASRWREIYEANRRELPSPAQLKVGQQLTIP